MELEVLEWAEDAARRREIVKRICECLKVDFQKQCYFNNILIANSAIIPLSTSVE